MTKIFTCMYFPWVIHLDKEADSGFGNWYLYFVQPKVEDSKELYL